MERQAGNDITELLSRAGAGDPRAAEELLPLVYGELRRLANARMQRERPGQTLQATGLVHEAYLRLVGDGDADWDSRGHFFAAAAEAMRRILIERARRKARIRHGGELRRTALQTDVAALDDDDAALLDLDRALTELEDRDERMAAVVKLRYFAGLGVEEVAAALQLSPRSVDRTWLSARTWLAARIGPTS